MTSAPHLLHVFSSFEVGGSQIRFCQLVNALGDRYRHSVIALDGRTDARGRLRPGAPVEIISFDHHKTGSLRDLRRFRRTLATLRPNLLLTYNWGAIEWGLVNIIRPICPHIAVVDGFGPEEVAASLPRRSFIRWFVYGRARSLVVPSRVLERVARDTWRIPARIVRYIPNGVDVARFHQPPDPALLAQLDLTGAEPVIGTIAGLRREKNVGRLVDAFARIVQQGRAARLVVIGDGPLRHDLEAQTHRLGLAGRVIFTGALTGPERLLGAFSIYAISSDTEQMPISLVEAMATGLPVASVDVGDVADMVASENGRFIQGRDAENLAQSLAALLDNPTERARIGAANRAAATARFTERNMVEVYDRLFASAMTGRP
ncbi:glycosyl transferase family 1 [Aliidongia dinghuensis]|uniref:Glycosyl transferase family 1 n=2 Tax=Aliidongia dinghuensis TaxID=1867774 RepID=A0A8J2YS19_9PROT|nr:glycosyl transferase family 1 [Aliidongia dinghuensis]